MSAAGSLSRYAHVPYRRCGRSGLLLPAISLGLYQNFDERVPLAACRAVVRRAFDRGITHFDLANNYGVPAGAAETIFGRILREDLAGHRDELVVATKAGYDMWPGPYGEWGSRKHVLASLDQSLRRLGLDYVDVFYSHRFDPATPLEETMEALATAVRQGKALYVGVSNYDAAATAEAFRLLGERGVRPLAHQTGYSLLRREGEARLHATVAESGAGVVAYQVLQRGLLTDAFLTCDPEVRRARLAAWGGDDGLVVQARALAQVAHGRGQTLAQLALVWALRDPAVATAVLGVRRPEQLDEHIAALAAPPLDATELARIDAILAMPPPAEGNP
jgi:L-glyceraldehyde 3-phosphate reductase